MDGHSRILVINSILRIEVCICILMAIECFRGGSARSVGCSEGLAAAATATSGGRLRSTCDRKRCGVRALFHRLQLASQSFILPL